MKRRFFGGNRFFTLPALFLFIIIGLCMVNSVYAEEEEDEAADHGIPVVYINIDESRGTIEDMLNSANHTVECYGKMSIYVPEGFHYADFPDNLCESLDNLDLTIRGRGNSSWRLGKKKPFKIKLDKKQDIFGLGRNKHWVLVANWFDPTLLRDRITGWLGDQMNFEFTPRGVPVDFVLTGEEYGTHYLGSYYFSENVRVDENRLEIEELSEEDTEYPKITGGYLLQNGSQVRKDSPDRFYTDRNVLWATDTPSFDTEGDDGSDEGGGPFGEEGFSGPELEDAYENKAQQEYIQNHVQLVEDTIFEGGTAYRDYIDTESAAKYWLVQTFCLNSDRFGTGSTYIYKDRDKDGTVSKFFWGPLWDFDYAWDDILTVKGMDSGHEWMQPMFTDHEEGGFTDEIEKQWPLFREYVMALIEDGGIIDQYYEETKDSAYADHYVWRPDDTEYTYEAKIEKLKTWIAERLAWFDEHLSDVECLVHTVTLRNGDEVLRMEYFDHGAVFYEPKEQPQKDGYIFLGWEDQYGNVISGAVQVSEDLVYTPKFVSEDEAVRAQDIAFGNDSVSIRYSVWSNVYQISYCLVPLNTEDPTVFWSSSDESIATVDENGVVTYYQTGEVIITATLPNGVSRELRLNITADAGPNPEAIQADREVIYMNVGEETNTTFTTVPLYAAIDRWVYEIDDESIISVNDLGVITAKSPGTAVIHIRTLTNDYAAQELYVCETDVTVIVSEKAEEIIYTVTSGERSTWRKGSSESISITVSRNIDDDTCFDHFTDVLTDGVPLVKDSDYTAARGSTVITLKPETLNRLSAGEHTVTVNFDDGKAETKLIILEAEKEEPSSPDTGDHANPVWGPLTAGSLLLFVLALFIRTAPMRRS